MLAAAHSLQPEVTARDDAATLRQKAQNPVEDVVNVPLQFNFNSGIGPGDDLQTLLNIQPVYPAGLNDQWNLINRTIIPVID
jgi:hypothetical protein